MANDDFEACQNARDAPRLAPGQQKKGALRRVYAHLGAGVPKMVRWVQVRKVLGVQVKRDGDVRVHVLLATGAVSCGWTSKLSSTRAMLEYMNTRKKGVPMHEVLAAKLRKVGREVETYYIANDHFCSGAIQKHLRAWKCHVHGRASICLLVDREHWYTTPSDSDGTDCLPEEQLVIALGKRKASALLMG